MVHGDLSSTPLGPVSDSCQAVFFATAYGHGNDVGILRAENVPNF